VNEKAKAASIYDVAKAAGVSHQTVSRVINNADNIREETRQKVLDAMNQLKYQPNRAARSLATSRSKLIGVLTSDAGIFSAENLRLAIDTETRAEGYFAVAVRVDGESEGSIENAVKQLKELGIEAIIVIAPQSKVVEVAKRVDPELPMVTIDFIDRPDLFSVSIDNYSGARIATRHLIEQGHKKILHIAGPKKQFESLERLRGYKDELQAHGLEPLKIVQGDWTSETGFNIGNKLASRTKDFTAIFACNDNLAVGLLHAFTANGINVPKDVSVVGFDDAPESAYFNPPLTTMHQDFGVVGRRAVALLFEELAGVANIRREQVLPTLTVRKSVAPHTARR
jgi:DNA-binding LacI/PurR family transcriptional regulator